jgi:hypothetical protein
MKYQKIALGVLDFYNIIKYLLIIKMCQSNCDNYKNTGEVIEEGGGGESSGIETGPTSAMYQKTDMVAGDLYYAVEQFLPVLNKLYVYSGSTWNVSGESSEFTAEVQLDTGELVEVSPNNDYYVKKTNTAGDIGFVGVVMGPSVNAGDKVAIAYSGVHYVACVTGTYTRANYLRPNATDGLASQTTSSADEPFAKLVDSSVVNNNGGIVLAFLHSQETF